MGLRAVALPEGEARMRRVLWLSLLCPFLVLPARSADDPPKPLLSDLKDLRSVLATPAGKVYVSAGGTVFAVEKDKAVPFAENLGEPSGMAAFGPFLFVADK